MKSPFPKQTYEKNACVYKMLANAKRLEILNIIKHEEHSVEEIVSIVQASKANISQHLAILRHAGIVVARRDGLNVYYRLLEPLIIEPCKVLYELRKKRMLNV